MAPPNRKRQPLMDWRRLAELGDPSVVSEAVLVATAVMVTVAMGVVVLFHAVTTKVDLFHAVGDVVVERVVAQLKQQIELNRVHHSC